jgi:hypothetical protein
MPGNHLDIFSTGEFRKFLYKHLAAETSTPMVDGLPLWSSVQDLLVRVRSADYPRRCRHANQRQLEAVEIVLIRSPL